MCTSLRHKEVVTKKRHRCHSCSRAIPAKSRVHYWVSIDGGDFGFGYSCSDCDEYLSKHRSEFDDCIYEGDLADCDFARHPILEVVA